MYIGYRSTSCETSNVDLYNYRKKKSVKHTVNNSKIFLMNVGLD